MSNVRPEWYRFRDALEQADFSTAATLLQNDPRLIDERNGIGETVLHFMAVENNQPAVEWLHAHGADLNATNQFGRPLLFEVAQLGYRDLVLCLIQHGADPHKKGQDGQTIEDYLAEFDKPDMIALIKEHATSDG
jgi:ankyrin repeat protein